MANFTRKRVSAVFMGIPVFSASLGSLVLNPFDIFWVWNIGFRHSLGGAS